MKSIEDLKKELEEKMANPNIGTIECVELSNEIIIRGAQIEAVEKMKKAILKYTEGWEMHWAVDSMLNELTLESILEAK